MQTPRATRPESRTGASKLRRSRGRFPPPSAGGSEPTSPGRVGIGARQELHRREQMPEMLAVVATPTAHDRALLGGRIELAFGEHGGERGAIFLLERARVESDAGVDRRLQCLVDFEQL